MSFGSQTGRTRSGAKSFSSKEKKQKRKKQEFHTHRRGHDQQATRPDSEEVRTRTVLALDKLGHQVISTEPGGYDLDDWVRSLDSLLDDFEEKVGAERVTHEFRARRQEAITNLVSQSRPGGADSEIESLVREEEEATRALDEAQTKAAARLASLREERDSRERELKAERQALAEATEAKNSRKFFSRILGAGPSTDDSEARVEKLESDVLRIEGEIERSRKARKATGGSANEEVDHEVADARKRLEAVRDKLIEAQSARQSSLQLAKEREIAAQTISGVISSMKLDVASTESTAP